MKVVGIGADARRPVCAQEKFFKKFYRCERRSPRFRRRPNSPRLPRSGQRVDAPRQPSQRSTRPIVYGNRRRPVDFPTTRRKRRVETRRQAQSENVELTKPRRLDASFKSRRPERAFLLKIARARRSPLSEIALLRTIKAALSQNFSGNARFARYFAKITRFNGKSTF